MSTRIYYSGTALLLWSEYRTPSPHRHLAAHLVVAPTGSLRLSVGAPGAAPRVFEAPAFLIAPDVWHTVETGGESAAVFLFDGTTDAAARIAELLAGADAATLEQNTASELQRICIEHEADLERVFTGCVEALDLGTTSHVMDPRVAEALAAIRELPAIDDDAIARLADGACLSQSRFSHLFREGTGIALNRYLVLEKMRRAAEGVAAHGDLTRAALDAGFASPSHFSATCQRMFGISMTEFLGSLASNGTD